MMTNWGKEVFCRSVDDMETLLVAMQSGTTLLDDMGRRQYEGKQHQTQEEVANAELATSSSRVGLCIRQKHRTEMTHWVSGLRIEGMGRISPS